MLKVINNELTAIGINYAFMEWNDAPVYPYFVGEYEESTPTSEDGQQETSFILNGFSRGQYSTLEDAKNQIANHFNKVGGRVVTTENSTVAIFYERAFPVPTGDAEIKRIQITLKVIEWKGN